MFVQARVQNTLKMEINTQDNGKTTRWKDKEHTNLLMVTVTKVAGKPMREMAQALSFGQVTKSTKDSGKLACEMAKARWYFLLAISILGSGKIVREMVQASFTFLMAKYNIMVFGKMISQSRNDLIYVQLPPKVKSVTFPKEIF